jgi:hypothetical protein
VVLLSEDETPACWLVTYLFFKRSLQKNYKKETYPNPQTFIDNLISHQYLSNPKSWGCRCGSYIMADIARYFSLHRSTVGKIITKRAANKREY